MDWFTLTLLKICSIVKNTFCPDPIYVEKEEPILFMDGNVSFEDGTEITLSDRELEMIEEGDSCESFVSKIQKHRELTKDVVVVKLSYVYDNKYLTHSFCKDDRIEPNLKT